MSIKIGVIMDPIDRINYKKDTTLALLWEAKARGWTIYYFEQADLFVQDGKAWGNARLLDVFKDPTQWFKLDAYERIELGKLDILLMRKDPPFNLEYIYTTYILELAEKAGATVLNKPQSLRDVNEKFYTTWFPELCPPTLVTRNMTSLREFLALHKDIVCKPLDTMGGTSVFRVQSSDVNASVIFETLTQCGNNFMMAQRFIPEIAKGDKRIILINGEPIPYALARIPATGEFRGNLAAGGKGVAQPLTEQDKIICQTVAPTLREKGLWFVGLDVIGHYLTEINITSPTCVRELDEQCNIDISKIVLNALEKERASSTKKHI